MSFARLRFHSGDGCFSIPELADLDGAFAALMLPSVTSALQSSSLPVSQSATLSI